MNSRPTQTIVAVCFLACSFIGCRGSLNESQCSPVDPDNPEVFQKCFYGSGSFGKWVVDEYGLPAYKYTLRQEKDPRALWWNSELRDRREHWHQIGNSRITAAVFNEGYIQLFSQENGFKWLNYYSEQENNYAGGFSYLYDGEHGWSTAYKFRPISETQRIFGLGYFRTEMEHRDLSVMRKTYAPYGDDPVLLSNIEIKNTGSTAKEITHYEYWDVNLHQMLMMLVSSGVLKASIPQAHEEERAAFNGYFTQSAKIDPYYNAAMVETSLKYPEANGLEITLPGYAKKFDDSPPAVFLAALNDDTSPEDGFIFDQSVFFGSGGASHPDGLGSALAIQSDEEIPASLKGISGLGQPLALIHKRKFILEPGESRNLMYAYGYTFSGTSLDFLDKYLSIEEGLSGTLDSWRKHLVYFAPESDPFLHREMAWHSYYLQSASYYRKYLNKHIVSQGGSYLFGHGFDGATRDYCIFSIPLSYINPTLAKEILEFVMMTTLTNGEMSYGNYGDVALTGALIYSLPSDLDIFFFWAISEYLTATRDFDFLDEEVPFYASDGIPSITTTTVLDHIRTAFDHLVNVVGVGEHNLIRLRTGDWSDGIVWFTDDSSLAEEKGESTFNTAFATAVLPYMAQALSNRDPQLASSMLSQAQSYRDAMKEQWVGKWYLRGWQGNGQPFGVENLFLEPQAWSLIAGIPDAGKADTLIKSLFTILDTRSPVGARILYPPKENIISEMPPGTDVNGGIWHATNSLLAWAYSFSRPDYAWTSLKKNTLASHAESYPDLWYGIWSGPDSYNAPESERPGEAAAHIATALTDFPVMNMNQHSNPLIALIKTAGIFPEKDGIRILPALPLKRWAFHLPLIGIQYGAEKIMGYYNGMNQGSMTLTVSTPQGTGEQSISVNVNGENVPFTFSDGDVSFTLSHSQGQRSNWIVNLKSPE